MSLLLDNTSLVTGICIIIPPENSLLVACRVVRHDKQILISLNVDIANSGICFNLLLPGVPLVTMVRFRLCMCMCVFFFLVQSRKRLPFPELPPEAFTNITSACSFSFSSLGPVTFTVYSSHLDALVTQGLVATYPSFWRVTCDVDLLPVLYFLYDKRAQE